MLPDLGQFIHDLQELKLDEELIQRIHKDLLEIDHQIQATGFQDYTVDQASYGDASVGHSLGYHHSLAHQKVSESLTAVMKDLKTFRDGFTTFRRELENADSGSAADAHKLTAATDTLLHSSGFDHTHDVNHHYHPGGGTHA